MMSPMNVEALKRRRPEWSPWLAVVGTALQETLDPNWEAAVPDPDPASPPPAPKLAGASIALDPAVVRRLLTRMVDVAARAGTSRMAPLKPALQDGEIDLQALMAASIRQSTGEVTAVAAASGVDAEPLQAIVSLVSLPLLHACNRRWAGTSPSWTHGYCPVCASWPAFAEMRGIERSRYLRCGRCGAEWHAHILHCAFCGTTDHGELVSLVPETPGATGLVEACRRCHGYLKVFTRLQATPPAAVMLEDLDSVDLDLAAIEQGYTRPAGPGLAFDVTVTARTPARRFAWNA